MKKILAVDFYQKVTDNLNRVIFGKRGQIELILLSIACNGHVLIEDIPGTGKTYLAKTLAKTLGGGCSKEFNLHRICCRAILWEYQFTINLRKCLNSNPDL